MKKILAICLMLVFMAGCATTSLEKTRYLTDGTKEVFKAKLSTVFQDFTGSDLDVSLNPNGITKAKAGAVQSDTSQVAADYAKNMVDLVKALLPYIKPIVTTPTP